MPNVFRSSRAGVAVVALSAVAWGGRCFIKEAKSFTVTVMV